MRIVSPCPLKDKIIKEMITAMPKAKCCQCSRRHKIDSSRWSFGNMESWILSSLKHTAVVWDHRTGKGGSWISLTFSSATLKDIWQKSLVYKSLHGTIWNVSLQNVTLGWNK